MEWFPVFLVTSVLDPKVQLTMMYCARLNVSMLKGFSDHLSFKYKILVIILCGLAIFLHDE